jgi:hypothetical protein
VVGLIVGFVVVAIVSKLPFGQHGDAAAAH